MSTTDISQLSSKQLEKLLKEKQKEEKQQRERERADYEKKRDDMIKASVEEAKELNDTLAKFKKKMLKRVEDYRKLAQKYGDIRSNSKGGFSLRTNGGDLVVKYERNTKNEFDERAEMAANLIQEFLLDTVKKQNQRAYSMISQLLSRNEQGDFNVSRVFQLLQLKDQFDDDRWDKAMRLMEEAYNNRPVSYSVSFMQKDDEGKDKYISLSFPSIEVQDK